VIHNLRGKLILSHLAVILVAFSVATGLLLSLVQSYFISALEQSLAAQAQLLAQALIPGAVVASLSQAISPAYNAVQQQQVGNIAVQVESKATPTGLDLNPGLRESNLAYLSQVSVKLDTVLETRFRVLDNQGIVLVDSAGAELGKDLKQEPMIASALQGQGQSQQEMIGRENWLFVSVPIWMEAGVAGVITIGQPLRDIAAVLSDLRLRLLLVLVIALPLSALVGWILARNIAQPVRMLTTATGRLSQGDYGYPLTTTGRDELAQLSRTFAAMRDQLQAVERMRTQFVSDVSHELRTPLTAIKGLVETLEDGAIDDPSVRDRFMASIEGETDRLIRLVNDLLILSRADSQALVLQRKEVDLNDLLSSIVERLQPQAASLNLALHLMLGEQPLLVSIDADRIEQILVNLLDNAMKHSPAGASIWVEGDRAEVEGHEPQTPAQDSEVFPPIPPGKWVVVSVTDPGEGITPKDLPHVFDRFYRSEPSRSRLRGGSGLGLSIAKALVEAHGGCIWLQSPAQPHPLRGPGPGTTASFALPIA